ncbi:MAG: hypothetical protein ABI668_09165 [Sphingorhabdus sp.]
MTGSTVQGTKAVKPLIWQKIFDFTMLLLMHWRETGMKKPASM